MAKQRIILVLAVCFSIAVFTGQTLSQMPLRLPKRLPGMTSEEYSKEVEKWFTQHRQQQLKRREERSKPIRREAWKRLLRVTERQCKLIEPKEEKVFGLYRETRVSASRGGRDEQSFHWNRPSESPQHPMEGKARDQMPKGYRIVEELIDLLEDKNSKEEEIRKKIDALQRAREKARKALPKARQELCKVLTTPRQEAVFLKTPAK